MPVPSKMSDLFTLAASNSPAGSDLIGNSLDDYLRSHAAIIRSTNALSSASIASASTTDLSTSDGEQVTITGTATINSLGTVPSGIVRELSFSGACTLTNSSAIVLPTGANITTAAGDIYTFRSLGSGNWVMTSGTRAVGYLPLSGGSLSGNLTVSTASTSATNVTINNTSTGGHSWTVGASGASGPGGAGYFSIYDNTAAAVRATIDTSGNLVMGANAQFSAVTVGGADVMLYAPSAGVQGFRSGTSGGGYKFATLDASGNFNTLNGGISSFSTVTAGNNIILGSANTVESDVSIYRAGVMKWYISVNSSELFGINRTNPSTGAFAEQVMAFPQSGNLVFSRTCQAPDFSATSDERLKSEIVPLRRGLDALKSMLPREYTIDGERRLGFLAQEVQSVAPEAVSEGADGYLSLSYGQVTAVLAAAILELDERLTKAGL